MRKIIQITAAGATRGYPDNGLEDSFELYALCDDGTVWLGYVLPTLPGEPVADQESPWWDWKQLPPIPGEIE